MKKDDMYEMEGTQCQFQMMVEREERGGVNLNLNLEGIDEELREWYCNRYWCNQFINVRHTNFVTRD